MDSKKEKLFNDNKRLVSYIISNYIKGKENYSMQDLYQEGYLALWRACLQFKSNKGVKFNTYAFPSIRNSLYDYVKKINKKKSFELLTLNNKLDSKSDVETEFIDRLVDKTASIEDQVVTRFLIEKSLKSLSALDIDLLKLYSKGYCNKDLAERLGIPASNVYYRLRKIRQKIKNIENSLNTESIKRSN